MSEAQPEPKRPTVEYLRQTWRENKDMGFRALAAKMIEQGYACSVSWCAKQKDEDPEWLAEFIQYRTAVGGPARTLTALELASKEASTVKAEHLMGVKAKLIGRLYDQIGAVPLDNIEDWGRAVDLLQRIDAQIHAMRGHEVETGKGSGQPARPAQGATLLAAVAPRPQIEPIRAPVAKGAH